MEYYRSRQCYESKVFHNTEASWFSKPHGSLKTDHFDKNFKECCSPIQYASFDTFKAKISQSLLHNQPSDFTENCDFSLGEKSELMDGAEIAFFKISCLQRHLCE